MNHQLGVIGGGNMAEAIIRGGLASGVLQPDQLIVADPQPERRAIFESLGVTVTDDNAQVAGAARYVLLAIKPQTLDAVAPLLKGMDPESQALISIMAGVRIARIAQVVHPEARIVRIMPNTPLAVGVGMSAIAGGPHATDADLTFTRTLFAAVGDAVIVEESQLDAVTAVSGSGPAYVFYLAEAMTEAGRQLGLSEELADRLTRQTILGAAMLMTHADAGADATPADLRQRVTSPGGTTAAALEHMDGQQTQRIIIDALQSAAARAAELGGTD